MVSHILTIGIPLSVAFSSQHLYVNRHIKVLLWLSKMVGVYVVCGTSDRFCHAILALYCA